jgi:uncharacterized protein YigE (DUF2233 family)
LVVVALVTMMGCKSLLDGNEPVTIQTQTATYLPTVTLATTTPTYLPDSSWESLQPGLDRRVINLLSTEGSLLETIYILRVDPAAFRLNVAYQPEEPLDLIRWQEETGALIVVNGGFFTDSNEATGVIVVDGRATGVSYSDFGGMLVIKKTGPELRWLPVQPYDPAEPLDAGLQSFPMLVTPGGQTGIAEEDGLPARRTVIGRDTTGRFIFLVAASGTFTLHEMSLYLVGSDLDLDSALNLDGGASSGMLLANPAEGIPAFSLLPSVITVHPK